MTGKALTVISLLLAGTVLYAQDAVPETAPAALPVQQENQETENRQVPDQIKTEAKSSVAEAEKAEKKIPDEKQTVPETPAQLLSVKDGSFRYSRIPGMELPKPVPVQTEIPAVSAEESETQPEQQDDVAGLFGITVKMANIAIKVFIVLLVAGLVIIYRIHSGRKKRNVFFKHRRK